MGLLNSALAKWIGVGLISAGSVVGVTYNHYSSAVKQEYREIAVEKVVDNGRVTRNTKLKIKGPANGVRKGETFTCEIEYNADLPLDHSVLFAGIDYSIGDILEDGITSYKKARIADSSENTSPMTGYARAGKTAEWVPSEQKKATSELFNKFLEIVPGSKELRGTVVKAGEFVGEFEKFFGKQDEAVLIAGDSPEWIKSDKIEVTGPIKTGLTFGEGSMFANYENNLWKMPVRISEGAVGRGKFYAYVYCDGGISGEFEIDVKDFPPVKKQEIVEEQKPKGLTKENGREAVAQRTIDNGRVVRNTTLRIMKPEGELKSGEKATFKIEYNADLPLDHSTLILGIDYSLGDVQEDQIVSYKKMRTANSQTDTSSITVYGKPGRTAEWVPSEQRRVPSELMGKILPLVPGYKELTGRVEQAGKLVDEFKKFTGELDKFLGTTDEATLMLREAPHWVTSDSVEITGPIKTGMMLGEGSVFANYEQNLWEIPVRIAEGATSGKLYAYVYSGGGIETSLGIDVDGGDENFSEARPEQETWPQVYKGRYEDCDIIVSVYRDRTEVESVFNTNRGDSMDIGIDNGSDGHFEVLKGVRRKDDGGTDEKTVDMIEYERMLAEERANTPRNLVVLSMAEQAVDFLKKAKDSVMRNYGK